MLSRSIPVVVIAALVLSAAASASAQDCTEGRVVTPETAGRCCWPAQTFSTQLGRCEGPPRCPEDFVAEGDSCVARQVWDDEDDEEAGAAATPTPGVPTATRLPRAATPWGAPLAAGYAGASGGGLLWPARPSLDGAVQDPRVVEGTDDGLLLAGLLFFGGGYLGGVAIGAIDQSARNCFDFSGGGFGSTGCDSWPLGFIPVVGGILAGSVSYNGSRSTIILGVLAGPFSAAIQILGMVFVGLALANPTIDIVPSVDLGDARLTILPHASSDSAGLALTVEL